jgi:hypothetical protein
VALPETTLNPNSQNRIRTVAAVFSEIMTTATKHIERFAWNECAEIRFGSFDCCRGPAISVRLRPLMNGLHFSQALVPGLIAGVLSIFTSWLWMGSVFHRFQELTPQTWRRETARSYALSSALHILAAVGIAVLFTTVARVPSPYFPAGISGSLRFAFACWGVFALPIVLEAAIYINLHPLVVLGQLLDWLSTSLLATVITALWRRE